MRGGISKFKYASRRRSMRIEILAVEFRVVEQKVLLCFDIGKPQKSSSTRGSATKALAPPPPSRISGHRIF